jgi:hypothetical protein
MKENEDKDLKVLSNLDVRIFIVTLFLSIILLSIAVIEFLEFFGIIKGLSDVAQFKLIMFYTYSETVPSLGISFFLSKSIINKTEDPPADNYQNARNLKDNKHSTSNGLSDSEDSDFGNFNPNLFVKQEKSNLNDKTDQSSSFNTSKPLFPIS